MIKINNHKSLSKEKIMKKEISFSKKIMNNFDKIFANILK